MENEKETTEVGQSVDEKMIAIISYLTVVGWIIAYLFNNSKSNLAYYHMRQSLLLILLGVVLYDFSDNCTYDSFLWGTCKYTYGAHWVGLVYFMGDGLNQRH